MDWRAERDVGTKINKKTLNSELQQMMQQAIDKTSIKIKVIERSGTRLARILQRYDPDPFKKKGCVKPDSCETNRVQRHRCHIQDRLHW